MPSLNSSALVAEYKAGKSTPDLAKENGVSLSSIRGALLKAGVVLRTPAEGIALASHKISSKLTGRKRGPFSETHIEKLRAAAIQRSALTARGYRITTNGYLELTKGDNVGRPLHRVLMETVLCRKLSSDEVVHHRDEDKANNNIENLAVMTRSDHTRLHRKGNHAIT